MSCRLPVDTSRLHSGGQCAAAGTSLDRRLLDAVDEASLVRASQIFHDFGANALAVDTAGHRT
jgi:hypothetical protein